MMLRNVGCGRMKIKTKKTQLKIQQTAFMLLAVGLLVILVVLFYVVIQQRALKKQATVIKENQAVLISEFLSDSAEFSCGSYCIDTDRMLFLKNRSVYSEFWPVSYIKLRKVYPIKKDIECGIGNYPDCSYFNIYENKEIKSASSVGSFVALCRYEKVEEYPTRICELGKILVGYEVR